MRFAVMTDVHGNAPALRAALREIDALAVAHIFCLGDMIGIGPDTNEVLELLFARSDVSMITGNHDESVLALIQGQEHPPSHAHVKAHHQWIAERLQPEFVPGLAALPRRIEQNMAGHAVLFTHYHIAPEKYNAPISADPFSPIAEPGLTQLQQLFHGCRQRLVCFGHHHPQHFFQGNGQTYLNPGSLGCHNKPAARYAIVEMTESGPTVDLREAIYDNTTFLASYETLEVPDREFILRIFHGGQM
ncbi:metallophosphoesterase family protein [Ectobacillus ponti]|uniref:Metallophosphatase family protein n=1 Tax=Ectobacillus ponti TaxID=2961894 RepID=A0AA41X883_9BACI|nr:metallophosphoesterase family protein [Ectobacillus ponti]MCP8970694.1 metallophosphatase family protein [Ectobacillus ponti]